MTASSQGFVRFQHRINMHRFVRATTRDDAVSVVAWSVWLVTGRLSDPPAVIEEAAVHQMRAAHYRHAGAGVNLWWVVTDAKVTVLAADSAAAGEAARRAVTVRCTGPQPDVFAHETQVLPCRASARGPRDVT